MAWITMAEGASLEEFQACTPPYTELPKGTKLKLTIETPWYVPIAPLADLFFAEWVAAKFINEAGAEIIDVEGIGLNTIIVHMEADPVWLVPLIWSIAAVALSVAIIIAVIKLEANIPEMVKWGTIALVAVSIAIVVSALSRRRRPRLKGG